MKFNKAVIVAAAATLCASMVLTTVNAANAPLECGPLFRHKDNANPATCGACLDDYCGEAAGTVACLLYDKTTQECNEHKVQCKSDYTTLADKKCMLTATFNEAKENCGKDNEKKAGKVFNTDTGLCACPHGSPSAEGVCPCPEGEKRNEAGECKPDESKNNEKTVVKKYTEMNAKEQTKHLAEMKKKCDPLHRDVDKATGECSNTCISGYATRKLDKPDNICYRIFGEKDTCDHKDRELITSDDNDKHKFCVCKGTKKPKTEGEDSANTECSGAAQLIMSSVVVLGSLATSLVFLL